MKSNDYIQTEINDRYLQTSIIFGEFYGELLSVNDETIGYMLDILRIPRWIIPNIIRDFYANKYGVMIVKGYRYKGEFPLTKLTKGDARLGFLIYYSALRVNMKHWFGEDIIIGRPSVFSEDEIKYIVKKQPLFFLRDTVDDDRVRKI